MKSAEVSAAWAATSNAPPPGTTLPASARTYITTLSLSFSLPPSLSPSLSPSMLTILNGILHCPQSIMDCILDLQYGVFVGALDENGHRLRIFHILNECELVLSLEEEEEGKEEEEKEGKGAEEE